MNEQNMKTIYGFAVINQCQDGMARHNVWSVHRSLITAKTACARYNREHAPAVACAVSGEFTRGQRWVHTDDAKDTRPRDGGGE